MPGSAYSTRGAKLSCVGSTSAHQFTLAIDMMKREVLAETDDVTAGDVGDKPALVAQATGQRFDLDLAGETGQSANMIKGRKFSHGLLQTKAMAGAAGTGRDQPVGNDGDGGDR